MTTLAQILFAARGMPEADAPAVEAALAAAAREAEEAWPAFGVPREAFVAYLADRLEEGPDVVAAIRALHARDLYLACACARGDAHAIVAFERACLADIDDILAKMRVMPATADDAKQILRRRFFVGEPGRGPRIAEYAGRGELARWVRASAVRVTLRLLRQQAHGTVRVDDSVLDALAESAHDPELDFLKRTYGHEFEEALRDAFDALAPRDRNLLRYHFGKGLSIDELGVLYRIHRATAARRLNKVNETLARDTRARLAQRLGLSRADVSSILRLIRSQIERALGAILAPPSRAT
jgi:RNA polymerase sigma-70 factor (ECF subfamily)